MLTTPTRNNIPARSMNTLLVPSKKSNHIAQTKPRKHRFQAYDLKKERTVSYSNEYGPAAKRLYRQYISEGLAPEMIMPKDLVYYPLSGRFIRQSFEMKNRNKITATTALKKYLATFKLQCLSYSLDRCRS